MKYHRHVINFLSGKIEHIDHNITPKLKVNIQEITCHNVVLATFLLFVQLQRILVFYFSIDWHV